MTTIQQPLFTAQRRNRGPDSPYLFLLLAAAMAAPLLQGPAAAVLAGERDRAPGEALARLSSRWTLSRRSGSPLYVWSLPAGLSSSCDDTGEPIIALPAGKFDPSEDNPLGPW